MVFYFFSLSVAAVTMTAPYKLYKKYRYKFINFYFYYVIFFYVYGFLNFTGRMMTAQVFRQSAYTFHMAGQVVGVIAMPVLFLSLYYGLHWIRELTDKRVPAALKAVYWSGQGLVLMGFFYAVTLLMKTKEPAQAAPVFQVTTAVEFLIIVLILLQLYFSARGLEDNDRKRLALNLGHIYLAGFAVMVLIAQWIRLPFYAYPRSLMFQILITFLFFFINIPPLVYLYLFLKKHHGKWTFQPPDTGKIAEFYQRFKITLREQEIIELLSKGKTNEEIGDELYISTKTVKNNVSIIYKKTGVSNRVQLTNLIRG